MNCGICSQHGKLSASTIDPHTGSAGIFVGDWATAFSAMPAARTAEAARTARIDRHLMSSRPVVADAGFNNQRDGQRGGAFHDLAGHVLGLVELLLGHFEQEFVVHL